MPTSKTSPSAKTTASKPSAAAGKNSKASPVWFADFRARDARENKTKKIERLFKAAGFADFIHKNDLVAIKIHIGERGNDTFLSPVFARAVVDLLKNAGARPFITDSNTLYNGSRHNAVDHLQTALEHGFGYATVGAPFIVADGLRGGSFSSVEINKKHFASVKIADAIVEAQGLIALSHFKGHEMAGFGGAIKNLAMGCAPAWGKCEQHASRFVSDTTKCIACGKCMAHCPAGAISWINVMEDGTPVSGKEKGARKAAFVDKEKCIGCGECLTVCQPKAMGMNWGKELGAFNERLAEYAFGAVKDKQGRAGFINFLMNITPDCDCVAWSDAPLVPDIGILASADPVALDTACYDLVNKQQGFAHSHLKGNHAPGEDKFKGVWAHTTGEVQLAHAEAIGLGSRQYELIPL